MPLTIDNDQWNQVEGKIGEFFAGFNQDLELVGQVAAEGIVRTTLAGIGAGDQPFAPYSASYQQLLDAVGGKPQQTVNLRGVFYPAGKGPRTLKNHAKEIERQKRARGKGAERRAYIRVTVNGRSFLARTRLTRPAKGVTDPLSEMSLDRIHIETTQDSLAIVYEPRARSYMIAHQENPRKGTPKRVWFSANKAAVREAMLKTLQTCLAARAQWFNDHQRGGLPPTAPAEARSAGRQALGGGA